MWKAIKKFFTPKKWEVVCVKNIGFNDSFTKSPVGKRPCALKVSQFGDYKVVVYNAPRQADVDIEAVLCIHFLEEMQQHKKSRGDSHVGIQT